ncbi:MAG: hypothetical protein KAW12_07170 [Candidatus Aminicenantes bacterium]|nr:hypothetical protein [Candidatus Aminicenantes bacterium]
MAGAKNQIKENFEAYFKQNTYTIDAFAALMGVTTQTVRNWTKKKKEPILKTSWLGGFHIRRDDAINYCVKMNMEIN